MLTTIVAIAGVVFGLSGLTLSLLNYRRDRPNVVVSLQWEACVVRDGNGRQAKLGKIYITNSGRRPVYIVAAGLVLFTLSDYIIRRTTSGVVRGRRLSEGDPPVALVVPDSVGMAKFFWEENAKHWRYVRAFAEDGTGKRHLSGRPKRRPFWGVGDRKFDLVKAEKVPMHIYECGLEQHELELLLNTGKWHIQPLEVTFEILEDAKESTAWPAHLRGLPMEKQTDH